MKRSDVLRIREESLKAYELQLQSHLEKGLLKKKQVADILAGFDDGFWTAVNLLVGTEKE